MRLAPLAQIGGGTSVRRARRRHPSVAGVRRVRASRCGRDETSSPRLELAGAIAMSPEVRRGAADRGRPARVRRRHDRRDDSARSGPAGSRASARRRAATSARRSSSASSTAAAAASPSGWSRLELDASATRTACARAPSSRPTARTSARSRAPPSRQRAIASSRSDTCIGILPKQDARLIVVGDDAEGHGFVGSR